MTGGTSATTGLLWVEVGFSVHGCCGRLTTDSKKEQRDLGNSGSTHKNSTFYSYEKYL